MSSAASIDATLAQLLRLHPKLIDLSLDRIERLLAALGHPERRLPPVVHVAGTNGKGSLIAFLRAMAEAAGYRVHAYTSPHLVRFNERIRLAGTLIDDGALADVLGECEAANAGQPITFFEFTTAAAFVAFARMPADILLLETGLGGRLDATNVVASPLLTVITPIAEDHHEFLGSGLAVIAAEKAGILKPGVPLVLARQPRAAAGAITSKAAAIAAPFHRQGQAWSLRAGETGFHYRSAARTLELPLPGLRGRHQIDNAACAIACLDRLDAFSIDAASIRRGVAEVTWPARLQLLASGALADRLPPPWELWLDGGHNPAAGAMLAREAAHWADRPLHLIVGMMSNKNVSGFLRNLAAHVQGLSAVPIPDESGSMPPAAIVEAAHGLGIAATSAPDFVCAIDDLAAQPPARVLICGSLYLAGRALTANAQSLD